MTGVPVPRVSDRASRHGLLRAWTVSVSLGELAGFCVPALVGGLLREDPPLLVLGAMVLAGVVEGAILGWSQARVLRQRLDGFSEARWVVGTALAAAGAWFLGMLPSTFHEQWSTWPTLLTVLAATLLGTLLLGSIGLGQWIELRRHVPRAARWILITAAGWGAGLVVFMAVATPLWRPGQATAAVVAIGVGAGALMAVSMAGLTGWGMQHLIDPGDRVRRPAGHPSRRPERRPWRRTFVAVEGLVALGGAAGTVQLLAGIATPPDSALDPFERFGVSGWGLPALWLLASVAVPSAVAAAAALHGTPRAPEWVLLASALLGVELLVQIPFVGLSVLQAVFGTVAVGMAVLAWQARRSGGWSPGAPATPAAPAPAVAAAEVAIAHESPNSTDPSAERVPTAHEYGCDEPAAEGQRPEGSRSGLVSLGGSTNR